MLEFSHASCIVCFSAAAWHLCNILMEVLHACMDATKVSGHVPSQGGSLVTDILLKDLRSRIRRRRQPTGRPTAPQEHLCNPDHPFPKILTWGSQPHGPAPVQIPPAAQRALATIPCSPLRADHSLLRHIGSLKAECKLASLHDSFPTPGSEGCPYHDCRPVRCRCLPLVSSRADEYLPCS